MRKLLSGATLFALLAVLAATPQPAAEERAPRFEPVEVVSTFDPIYPANAASWGTVVLQVTVDDSGGLESITVVQALAPFTEEAQRAVKKWKFKPARLNGQPVRAVIAVAFTFPPRPVG